MIALKEKNGTIFVQDAIKLIKNIPSGSIDLILTDPPYNISKKQKIDLTTHKVNYDFGEWDHNSISWKDFIDDFIRILKPNGVMVIFYDRLYIGDIGQYCNEKGLKTRHIGAWVKTNPVPQTKKVKWMNGLELFIVITKNTQGKEHHFNYKLGMSPEYFISPTCSGPERTEHPTQKREDLIEWIMSYWSFEQDTVFDPFCGSGTVPVVAKKLNRKYIAADISQKYIDITISRIKRIVTGTRQVRFM